MSSTDVDPTWFTENTGEDPLTSRPLSQSYLLPWTGVEPGQTAADLTIPTITDAEDESAEVVQLQLRAVGWPEAPELGTVTGTVTE